VGLNQKEQKQCTFFILDRSQCEAVFFILAHIPINDIGSTPS